MATSFTNILYHFWTFLTSPDHGRSFKFDILDKKISKLFANTLKIDMQWYVWIYYTFHSALTLYHKSHMTSPLSRLICWACTGICGSWRFFGEGVLVGVVLSDRVISRPVPLLSVGDKADSDTIRDLPGDLDLVLDWAVETGDLDLFSGFTMLPVTLGSLAVIFRPLVSYSTCVPSEIYHI